MKKTLALLALLASPAHAADHLTVMLDWFVNPDHGPIILAQQKGYFADEGLDVQIVTPADPSDPPKMVAAGQADIGVGYQPQLYLEHAEGLPVVRVGTLVGQPLYCVMVKADGPATLHNLTGHKIGFSVAGIEQALLMTMLKHNGVDPASVELINVNFSLSPALMAGQVDAVAGAFRNFELEQMRISGSEGRCFNPEDNGVPAYDELIYLANPKTMKADAIRRFLHATERAEADIAADPAASWEVFKTYSSDLNDALNAAAWTRTVGTFAAHPMALDAARYQAFGDFMVSTGLIQKAPAVADIAVDLSAN